MRRVLGMPFSSFLSRILSEPLLVLKTCLLFWWLHLRMWGKKRRLDSYIKYQKEDLVAANVYVPAIEQQLDYPKEDLDDKTGDSVFVYGENSDGSRLVAKITRRKFHNEFWLSLTLPDGRQFKEPYPEKVHAPSTEFAAGGLRIKCRTPFRQFRVSFNGLLREDKEDHQMGELVHVKFSFACPVSSAPFDVMSDIHPSVMADYLAKQPGKQFPPNLNSITDYLDSIIQSLNFYGTVAVDGSQDVQITLWGVRKRSRELFPTSSSARLTEFIGYSKDGQVIYSGECYLPSTSSKLPIGFYLERSSLSWPITDCQMELSGKKPSFNGARIKLVNERGSVTASVNSPISSIQFQGSESGTTVHGTKFSLDDGDEGFGIYVEYSWGSDLSHNFQAPLWSIEDRRQKGNRSLALPLGDVSCQDSSVSGGKGSSLATLTSLSRKYDTGFKVPSGFVVTTNAYAQFYLEAGVEATVAEFEKNAWSYTPEKIKDTCEQLVKLISKTKLPENVKKSVENQFSKQFPNDGLKRRFAVRSSASGEDSEEMSAAGQMSTLLGLEGLENIFEAIVKCWASQFSFTAIQYKRQNGQELNSPMAVVVQEMVAADVAGVLFTCDPVTGNPKNVTITANYGLGESVVSASSDPDTLVYLRKEGNEVEFKSSLLGKKTTKVVMGETSNVVEQIVDPNDSTSCCLPNDKGLVLGTIGLQIEEAYGFPVDIEWAYKDNQLYMLQARPITTVDLETKYEVANAASAPIRAEDEFNTKANVGEVMPGAMSHLSISLMTFFFAFCMEAQYGRRNEYAFPNDPFFSRFGAYRNNLFLSLPNFMLRFYKKGDQSFLAESNQIAGFGRILDDQRMFDQADRRNQSYPTTFVPYQVLFFIYDFITGGRRVSAILKAFWQRELDLRGFKDSKDLYDKIFRGIMDYEPAISSHMVCSMTSSIYNSIALGILASSNKGWDTKVFSDFALIMSSCGDIESADIPKSMKALAAEVRKCIGTEKFQQMTAEQAVKWLENTTTSAGKAYQEFLERHGHRCLKEFDVHTKPWRVNRLPLVRTIQDYISQKEEANKSFVSVDEVMRKLRVPLSTTNRLLMRLLIPLCRKGVFDREKSKSLLVKAMDHMRKGFWFLGEQMVKEGRLPDQELIFFLGYRELHELICTRSPSLVQRAIRRRQIFPELDKLRFPEITKGLPKTLAEERGEEVQEVFVSDLEMKGTPVSQGTVKAFARVATNIEEAAHIKSGEILIAYSTDIAWSPYFPLLSGVATELGGLISHGAVVAREYGLPCVVGVANATRMFKTGDFILLDGNTGIIKRLENIEQQ